MGARSRRKVEVRFTGYAATLLSPVVSWKPWTFRTAFRAGAPSCRRSRSPNTSTDHLSPIRSNTSRIPQSGWSASPQGSEAGAPAPGATRRTTSSSQLRALDFDVPETISFEGVETLVMVSAGTEEDDVVISRHNNAITAAERDGVRHIVYTSLTDAGDHLGFALAHRWTECRLRHGTPQWTILRNGLYAELIGQLLAPRERVISAPFGQGGVAAAAANCVRRWTLQRCCPSSHRCCCLSIPLQATDSLRRLALTSPTSSDASP